MWFLPLFGARASIPVTFPLVETWTVPNLANSMNGDRIWTPYIGTNQWDVFDQGIVLEDAGGIAHGGRLNLNLGTSDYRVGALVTDFAHPGSGTLVASVCARMQGDESLTFYALDLLAVAGVYSLLLLQFLPGEQTSLASVGIAAPVGTSSIELEVTGDAPVTLQGFLNGARLINTTDTTGDEITTGQFAGIQGVASGVGNRTRMDTFMVSAPVTSGSRRRAFYGLTPLTGVR